MTRVLILGRFQPPHVGHLNVIEAEGGKADHVIVVIGSAQASYTTQNPFTAGERIEMLHAALEARGVTNALLIPIFDLNRHAEWVAYVESLVPPFDEVVSNNPLTHELFEAKGYKVRSAPWHRRRDASGTKIRERLEAGKDITDVVDPSVAKIIKRLRAQKRMQRIREDSH
ncbi:MAG TPA: nicotinamide-nucleotide adenylyltransferase [Candidatus Thermoplasmatota archaeon]